LSSHSIIQFLNGFFVYTRPHVVRLFFLGFSAGLPILLVFSSLSVWLREAGVERSTIGFFSWVTLAYGFKWIWAPAVDRVSLPLLGKLAGQRRSWLFLVQTCLIFSIGFMAFVNPQQDLYIMSIAALLVAFFSASQDIVIDAFRIESGNAEDQAAMAATYQIGYRLAMILASAGSLLIADHLQTQDGYDYQSWQYTYLIMAGFMSVGLLTTWLSPEPDHEQNKSNETDDKQGVIAKIKYAFIQPVLDLLQRYKWQAVVLIVLICTYRVADIVLGVMSNVFYLDMGYTKSEIGTASKVYGLIMTLLGALISGALVNRYGVLKILLIGAVMSAITNFFFITLSQSEHSLSLLYLVISIDNLSAGIAATSFIAFISLLANKEFTATQYAWLSSAMLLFPKMLGGFSGVWLEQLGYTQFFTLTAVLGIPTCIAIIILMKQKWHA
jgi:PAT family beta-lactamase induction signal transducer AmpG